MAVRGGRAGGVTARAAVLGLVACAIALALAYPLRTYLSQRAEIAHLGHQQQATEQRVAALRDRQQQLGDPAVTIADARQRLHFVLPGETAYVILPPAAAQHPVPLSHRRIVSTDDGGTWYSKLWHSVTTADASTR